MVRDLRDRPGQILRTLAATSMGKDEPSSRIYMLGGAHEHRVNLPAQQSRGLNLVWALCERDRLGEGKRVIVIGAGVAGATFAAAAARKGAEVLLIDEHEEPVTTQRAATQRYLHPRLFDWPIEGFDSDTADVPFLNWRAGVSSNVRNQLVAGFVIAVNGGEPTSLAWLPQCWVLKLTETANETIEVEYVAFEDVGSTPSEVTIRTLTADLVVLAPGFLPERRIAGAISGSYWRDDRLAELRRDILIVGDGDGALTELFRVALAGAQNDRLWHQQRLALIVNPTSDALRKTLLDIEGSIRIDVNGGSLERLTASDSVLKEIDRRLLPRRDRNVKLLGAKPILRSNSFLINRFIAARLAANSSHVTLRSGRVDVTDVAALSEKRDVIWRSGPPPRESALAEPFFSLRGIVEAVGHNIRQGRRAGLAADVLDETRTPWWDGYFSPSKFTGPLNLITGLDRLRPSSPDPRRPAPDKSFADEKTDTDRLARFVPRRRPGQVALPCPDNLRRIKTTAQRMVRLAATLLNSVGQFWWLEHANQVPHISLDMLAIAVDLAPVSVAMAIANNPQSGLALAQIRPHHCLLPRIWVIVARIDDDDQPVDGLADFAGELADLLAVMKAPATWTDFDLDTRETEEGGPLLAPTGKDEEDMVLSGQLIPELMEAFGDVAGLQAAEGFTRSAALPKELVLDLLSHLSRPGVLEQQRQAADGERRMAEVAVDVFTRSIASQDPAIARPALLLFGQLVGVSNENGPLLTWTRRTLTRERPKHGRDQIGEAIMWTSLARIEPLVATNSDVSAGLTKPLPLEPEHILDGISRAHEQAFGRHIIGVFRLLTEEGSTEGAATMVLANRPFPIDLMYAGLIAE